MSQSCRKVDGMPTFLKRFPQFSPNYITFPLRKQSNFAPGSMLCLRQQAQWRENTLAQFHIPGAIQPPVERQFEGVAAVPLEQFFHLLRQFFAIDFNVDFVVADGTEAVQVGSADG